MPVAGGQAGSRGLTGAAGVDEVSVERAKRYRAHAQEIRLAAEDVKDAESRAALLRLAGTYERLAAKIDSKAVKFG